jgi:ankyrin repeat protein
MSRSLSPNSNLDVLRAEAKRWLKAIAADDPEARARFRAGFPHHTGTPKLREVQQALAREYGFPSWAALKQELEDRARTASERTALFLEKSVHRYGTNPATQKWGSYERDGPARGALAARLLARYPDIARDSIHTAVAAHDVAQVQSFLRRNASLARERSAFDGWPPLVRLAYARLPLEAVAANALAIATLLLDAGADPNAGWTDGANAFTTLVGVIGGGEAGQATHPIAEAFARLLIARGADPFAPQALYNTSLGPDSTFWLELLWSESAKRGETGKWTGPAPTELGGAKMTSALDYLLGNAVPQHVERTRWLLEHGANARAVNAYSREPVIKHAVLAGREDVVALLVAHGAARPSLTEEERFLAAAMCGDLVAMRQLATRQPQFLKRHEAMFAAIRQQRADVAQALLDLGMSADVGDAKNFRALHYTTHCGAAEIARLLIARGAEIDPFELRYGGTPLTHASYQERPEMVELLVPHSRNFRGLCSAGAVERLRELLSEEPDRANREDRPGEPALFCLPGDDEKAVEVVELLLSFNADPTFKNPLGQTPAQAARRRGLDEAAAVLEDAEEQRRAGARGPR